MTGIPPLVPSATKEAWRGWARERRVEVDPAQFSQSVVGHLAAWEPLRRASTALLYLPMAHEVDVSGIADGVIQARLVVTRTPPEGPLTLHPLAEPLELHRLGFRQPLADAPRVEPAEVDGALVPGLAFDRGGCRLGRGRGYFDELLGRLRADAVKVGVTARDLIVARLPCGPNDVAMTHLASELGVGEVA